MFLIAFIDLWATLRRLAYGNRIIAVTYEVRERPFNEYEAGGSIHTDGAEATLVYVDRGVRPPQCDRTGGPSQGGSIYPKTPVYLVSCPDRTLYAREGTSNQIAERLHHNIFVYTLPLRPWIG